MPVLRLAAKRVALGDRQVFETNLGGAFVIDSCDKVSTTKSP
jgi:hypothetical protein